MKPWYEIKSKADRAEIWIYEEIGEDFWTGNGITAKNFQKELAEIKASQIDLHINSPGGAVFDGITIYNLIKQHPANVTTYIDGLAASIASVIALAGDKVIMADNALYMMHNPSGLVMGNASDMRSMADVLDKIAGTMTGTYAGKSGKKEDEISELMNNESWFTAKEALEAGFIDEIGGKIDMAACVKFAPVMAKAGFKNVPDDISGKKEMPSVKEAEKALRDAGFSRTAAKTILSKGYSDDLRDADVDASNVVSIQRDAEPPKPIKKDRIADLLIRAEKLAPSGG